MASGVRDIDGHSKLRAFPHSALEEVALAPGMLRKSLNIVERVGLIDRVGCLLQMRRGVFGSFLEGDRSWEEHRRKHDKIKPGIGERIIKQC